jgi:predicted aminopeptidase
MRFTLIIFLSLLLVAVAGCAKLGYLTEQGIGQVRLQMSGTKNEDILSNPKISPSIKRKILLVEEYKKFFYYYFGQPASNIYTKTTMLDNKAVTYLVIASPHTEIKAHEFEFPIMGSFPYLGFFKLDSAKEYAKDLQEDENLVTWIRPVYAYSTLGYLEDRILSSFFNYDDVELAELVFHELFHTIFFIKDDVDLNENLANLYGKEMLQEYFQGRPELKTYLETLDKKTLIDKRVVELIGILKGEFAKLGGFNTNEKADELTDRFVNEVFKPDLRNMCVKIGLDMSDCELKDNWNQASFAAFLTYEEDQDFLTDLKKEKNLNLKDFLAWLKTEVKDFEDQKKIESFSDYLKLKVPHAPLALDRSHSKP